MKLRSSHGPFSSEDVSKYFDIAVAAEGGAVIVSDLKKLEAPEFTSWKKFLTGSHYPFDTPMTIYPHAHAFNGDISKPYEMECKLEQKRLECAMAIQAIERENA